ncbi:MAG: KH domain-containing protein [Chloroflexi bacterium]|nr:KH domain-containing protein [Chloroflexota bacterium]
MKELVEYIAKSLVDDPSQVDVEVVPDGKFIVVKLYVAAEDTGRVIGKDGRVANAIRTLLRAMATNEGKRVTLKIID